MHRAALLVGCDDEVGTGWFIELVGARPIRETTHLCSVENTSKNEPKCSPPPRHSITPHTVMMGALSKAQIVGVLSIALTLLLLPSCNAFSSSPYNKQPVSQTTADIIEDETSSRRNFVALSTASLVSMWLRPSEANAVPDCMKDCVKNCKLIAPKVCIFVCKNI